MNERTEALAEALEEARALTDLSAISPTGNGKHRCRMTAGKSAWWSITSQWFICSNEGCNEQPHAPKTTEVGLYTKRLS